MSKMLTTLRMLGLSPQLSAQRPKVDPIWLLLVFRGTPLVQYWVVVRAEHFLMGEDLEKQKRTLVLVHGLGRTSWSMIPLALYFRSLGYEVIRLGYGSRKGVVSEHASQIQRLIIEQGLDGRELTFIAHSLGSRVVQYLLENLGEGLRVNACIYLGPPFGATKSAAIGTRIWGSPWIFGPSLKELATSKLLPDVKRVKVFIIAGGTGNTWGFCPVLGEDNDGLVRLSETFVEGATKHKVLRVLHPLMLVSPAVMRTCREYLEEIDGTNEEGVNGS